MCVYLNIFIFWGDNHMIYICIKLLKIQNISNSKKKLLMRDYDKSIQYGNFFPKCQSYFFLIEI